MEPANLTLPESGSNLPEPQAFNTKGASRITGMSESWLSKARMGITATPGPEFKKVGRKVIYTLPAIQAWLHN